MTDSCEIMFSVGECLKTVEMKKFVVHGTFLQMKITPIMCPKKNTFTIRTIGGSFNKSGNDTQPLRKSSDFTQALSTLKRVHQEAGGDQLEPIPHWKYKTMETSIEFFLYLVATARILVVFPRIHRKSRRKRQAKACDRSGQPVVYRTLAKTS